MACDCFWEKSHNSEIEVVYDRHLAMAFPTESDPRPNLHLEQVEWMTISAISGRTPTFALRFDMIYYEWKRTMICGEEKTRRDPKKAKKPYKRRRRGAEAAAGAAERDPCS